MAYYDALVAKWATLSGTTQQKLTTLNALTVVGPVRDVEVSSVVGVLLLAGVYPKLARFAQGTPTSDPTHDAALYAMGTLMAWLTAPNAPSLQMSNPVVYATVQAMANAGLAQEAALPGSVGFTQGVSDSLFALSASTVPWWQANGYNSTFNTNDLVAAGGLV